MEDNTSQVPLESNPTPEVTPETTPTAEVVAEPVIEKTVHEEPKIEEPVMPTTPDLSQTEISAPQYAGGWIRFLAYLIDALIITIVLNIFRAIGGESLQNAMAWVGAVYIIVMLAVKQQTVGMMVLKLRLVSVESGTPNWWLIALMRQIIGGLVCAITLGIGYLIIFFTDRKQGLHDMIAKTYIIKE